VQRSSLLKLALATGGVAAAGAAAGIVVAGRRWAAADEPEAATRLTVPDGTTVRIPAGDKGEISATVTGDDGDGRTFVLVHGWTNDRRIWAPVARLLAERGHRVVLYDQRGHGDSRPGDDGLTIDAIGADMATVLEHLDVRDAVVAGHSMGGMAAQSFAIQFPQVLAERVSAVALVSTACSDLGVPGPAGKLAPLFLGSSLVSRFVANQRLGPLLVRNSLGPKPALTNLRVMQETFAATAPDARAAFYTAMAGMDLSEGLSRVDVPVVVISGTRDQLVEPSNSRRLAKVINGARFEAVPDAGHMLPLETPDLLADLLEDLASKSSSPMRAVI
jgi:non-heme chloroperoxidase